MRLVLEALDEQQVDRSHVANQFLERRLRRAAMLVHARRARRRGDHHYRRARRAVTPAVLAGLVDIEGVMRMLQGRDSEAAARQFRQQPRHQRRLAAAAPAGKPEDAQAAHATLLGFAALTEGSSSLMWVRPARR